MRQQYSFVRLVLSSLLSFAAILLFGCGGGHPYTAGVITITADNATVSAGSTTQLHATQYDILGVSRDISASVTWTSSTPSVATVSSSGLLTGAAAGTTTITATYSTATGTLGITIGAPSVTSLAVTPSSASVYTNGTQQFTATATYANSTTANVSSATTWSVLPSSVATISSTGLLTAVAPGSFTVTATNGGKTTSATGTVANAPVSSIVITPANPSIQSGNNQQFTATATYADGSTQNVTSSVTWTSSNPALLSINASGLATAYTTYTPASVTLTGTIGSITQTTTVSVVPSATVTSLIVEPTSSSIAAGTAETHTALALFSDGSQQDVTNRVTWTIATNTLAHAVVHANDTGTVATVDQTGMDQAVAPGTAILQASYAGIQSQSTVIVTPATVTALEITASRDLFPVGAVQQLILTGTFSDGSHQDLSLTANWKSAAPAIATINTSGWATALGTGNVQFSASFGGLTAQTTGFQVLPPSLVSTVIQVPFPIVIQGISEQLRLIGIYSDGSSHDLTKLATWSSADPSVFPVDANGVAYGRNAGSTQVTGTALGKSAITNVSNYPSTLKSIQLLPNPARFALGTTTQFTALGTFGTGSVNDITNTAVWRSSDPTVFTIDASGRAKSGKVGTATLSATLLGVTQTLSISVTNATLTRLAITPSADTTITTSSGHLYKARGFFTDGTSQDLTNDVTWSTTDETIASIDNHGLALGMKPGQINVTATLGTQTVSSPLTVTNATLLTTSLLPGNTELPIFTNRQYTLLGTFSDGTTEDLGYDAIWFAPTPTIADVLSNGEATGISPGIGEITAQHGLFSATTPVTVTNATLTGVALTPSTATIRRYGQQPFTATGTFSDGYTMPLLDDAVFNTSDPTVASIDANALATGSGIGSTSVSAVYSGMTATSNLTVQSDVIASIAITPANLSLTSGHTQQLTATATYADGSTQNVTSSVTWTSSNPAVFAVDANGLAAAYATTASTSVNVTAQLGTTTQTFTVTVNPPTITPPPVTLTSIAVTPTSSHIAAGTTQQLTLTGTYSDGSMQNLSSAATWTTTTPATATVSSTGLVTAAAAGTVTITAQLGSMQSTAVVIVSNATLQSVALSPSGASFANGTTQQFNLTGTFTDGSTQNLNAQATWTTSNTAVATVSTTGLVTGTGTGPVTITATINGQTASTTAQITPSTLVSVAITPATASFAKGTTQQFHATATYSDNTTRDVTSSAIFTTSNASVVSITSAGLAMGMGVGTAQITVTIGNQTATTQSVTITPATLSTIAIYPNTVSFASGTTEQFTAIATFSDNTTQNITTQAVWTSTNPQAVTIDANGLAASSSPGSAQITATLNGITATTGTVTVTPASLVGIAITPTTAQIAKGTTQQFTATGTYTDGTTQNVTNSVTWTTSNPGAASISASGLATGNGSGAAQISAVYLAKTATPAALTVTNATLLLVTINPAAPSVATGTTTQVAVIGHFSDGTTQDLTSTATFASSNPAAATVSTTGLITGVAPGLSTITITAGGDIATVPVTVTNATLVSLAITPTTPPSFAKGTTQQFTATGTFSDGSTQNLSTQATWISSNPTVFTVDHNGLATGTGIGSATLTATSQGQTATTPAVQVSPAIVSTIAVTPTNASLVAGSTQQFTAQATYSDGTTQNVTNSVTWNSTNTNSATISSTGVATAVASGNTTISAQSGSIIGSTTLSVTSAPGATLTGLSVTPTSSHLAAGTTQQLTATASYSDGTTQNVTGSVTWTTAAPSIATINSTGLITSVAPGTTTLQASLGTLQSTATVIVSTATLHSVAISPSGASFAAGATQQFTLTGTYTDGTTQNLSTQATWTSSNILVATISNTGNATGLLPGSVQFTAAYAGFTSTTATNTVTPATLVSVTITPTSPSFAKGTTQQFTATATYSDGFMQDVTSTAVFTTSNPTVVTLSGTGLATGAGTGSAQVTATYNLHSATTNSVTVTPASLASIAVTPQIPTFASGTTQQFTATGTFTDGSTQNLSIQAVWTSSNPSALTIDANGLAASVSPGTAQITAAILGLSSSTGNVTVTPATLSTLTITPTTVQIAKGTTQQMTATGTYTDGSTQNVTNSVTWTTSNGSVAGVDANGLATGTGAGSATITAAYQGKIASTTSFQVTPATLLFLTFNPLAPSVAAGTGSQVIVTGTFTDGTTQNLSNSATYTSSNPAAATVSSTGIVNGIAPGISLISVQANGVSGSFLVTVTNATLVSIAITPTTPPSFAKGTTEQFTATGTYSDGATQNLTTQVTWTSSNTSVFTIDHTGLATGAGAGTASLSATFQGQTATTPTFQVTPATATILTVSPINQSLTTGTTVQYTATAVYTDGSTTDVTSSVTWTSSNTSTALITSGGLALASVPGTTTIAAQYGLITGSTTLTATLAPIVVTSVTVTPANGALAAGSTQQYTATAHYSDGSTQNVTSTATWTSTVPANATVNSTGFVTGVLPGNSIIAARFNLITGSTSLTITAANATLTSIAVSPANPSLAAGATQQFAATATYSDSSTQNVTGSVTWSSSTSAATINAAGLASAVSTGSTLIAAQLNGTTGSTTFTVTPATLVALAITPGTASIAKGNTQQFTATATYSDGSHQNVTGLVTWSSSFTTFATISTGGLATGVNGGLTLITAALSGQTATVAMTVSPATLVSLAVTPATVSIANGTSQQYKATGTMTDGSTQDLTTSVAWSSSNTANATIDLLGFATAHNLGSATISATAGTITSNAALTITAATPTSIQLTPAVILLPAGGTQQLLGTATFSDGTSQNVTTSVTYTSSDPAVATVDTAGKLTATGAGTSTITATLGSTSTTALATITSATLSSIAITPANPNLAAGESQQLTATGTYTDGSTQDLTHSVLWTTANPLVAAITLTGNVTAILTCTTSVNASFLTINSSTTLTVSSAVVTSIAITPASVTLAAGQTQQFTATATLSDLTQQNVTSSAAWSVSNPSKATITASGGFLTTNASGSTQVTATLNAISGSSSVTIQPATLSSLTITPSPLSLPAGTTQQLAVTGHYADGSTADLTASATYISSQSSAAAVNSTGMIHGVATGSATITATVNGISRNVSVTVTNAILSSIAITPSAPSLPAGVQQQLTATGTYSDGSTADITTHVQWSSSSPTTATVSSTGLVNSLAAGSSTLTATLNGVSQAATLTVTAAVLQSIAVTASQSSFALGLSLQLTATGTYSDGSTRDLTATTTWSSQTPSIGIVNSSGLATGVTTGIFNARATTGGSTGTLSVTVLNAVLQSIVVTPASSLILNVLGSHIQYTATGHFSDGSTQNITNTAHWAITSGLTLGSISSTGSFSPLALGVGTITATSGTISGSTGFTVVSVL